MDAWADGSEEWSSAKTEKPCQVPLPSWAVVPGLVWLRCCVWKQGLIIDALWMQVYVITSQWVYAAFDQTMIQTFVEVVLRLEKKNHFVWDSEGIGMCILTG